MANLKSSKKRARQTPKRTARNTQVRSTVKSAVRAAREAATSGSKDAKTLFQAAVSTIAKAGSKGVLHKKAVARRISRLAKASQKAPAPTTAKRK
jgi:small subunit ribosomal protein S20